MFDLRFLAGGPRRLPPEYASAAAAQGTLAGTVVDAETGEPMIGASVFVAELGTGAATDIDGRYTVRQVPAGSYTVRFSYIGYGAQTVENAEVTAGETTTINVQLSIGAELAKRSSSTAEEIIEANSEVGPSDRLRAQGRPGLGRGLGRDHLPERVLRRRRRHGAA